MTRTTRLQLGATLAAVVLVSALVLRVSEAAFTATTENAANNWEAGTVTLTDNDGGSALFDSATDGVLAPGDTIATKCIEVTYTGNVAPGAAITLAATSITDSDGAGGDTTVASGQLSDDLDVTADMGAAGATCTTWTLGTNVYTGTLAAFTTVQNTWTPVLGTDTVRAFQFTVTLGADTADDAQGDGSTATFTWTATS